MDCSANDRYGLYLIRYGVQTGNCGGTRLLGGWVDHAMALPGYCALDAPDRWSDDECTFERAYTCPDPADDLVTSWSGATTQRDDDAEFLTGSANVQSTRLDGTVLCTGTIELELSLDN